MMKRQDGSTENVLSMKPLSVLHLRDRLRRRPDAVAIGPGLGQTTEARYWVEAAMALEAALVLDADALNVLASNRSLIQQLKQRTAPACITPHPGEAARLLGRSSQDVQAHSMAADQLLMRGIGPLGMTASEVAFELRNVLNAKA
jgi:NAD(P)H-hydrate repair Nnr-like enzyme with NAD(P)H-hydrate dehydratase domain